VFTSTQFMSQTLKTLKITPSKINLRERLWKVWRYQGGNQRPQIKEGQTIEQKKKDKQQSTKQYTDRERETCTPVIIPTFFHSTDFNNALLTIVISIK
jgi:hypothetical protein